MSLSKKLASKALESGYNALDPVGRYSLLSDLAKSAVNDPEEAALIKQLISSMEDNIRGAEHRIADAMSVSASLRKTAGNEYLWKADSDLQQAAWNLFEGSQGDEKLRTTLQPIANLILKAQEKLAKIIGGSGGASPEETPQFSPTAPKEKFQPQAPRLAPVKTALGDLAQNVVPAKVIAEIAPNMRWQSDPSAIGAFFGDIVKHIRTHGERWGKDGATGPQACIEYWMTSPLLATRKDVSRREAATDLTRKIAAALAGAPGAGRPAQSSRS